MRTTTPALDKFETPIYTVAEAARYLRVPDSTFRSWASGYRRRGGGRAEVLGEPVIATLTAAGGGPTVPFVGLAEGLVLAALRHSGVPLQRIRPALTRLASEFGVAHALASRRLYTDGAEVLFDYADESDPDAAKALRSLVVVRNGQHVFNEVVDGYLRRVEFGADGYPTIIELPGYSVARVVVDPARGFGQPIFRRGGARLEDVLALFRAGESLEAVAEEYGVPPVELEDVLRVALAPAA